MPETGQDGSCLVVASGAMGKPCEVSNSESINESAVQLHVLNLLCHGGPIH